MENIILTFTKEEQAIFFVALFLLLFAIVMGYAMVFKTTGYILMKTTRLATASVISSRENAFISICCLHPYLSA